MARPRKKPLPLNPEIKEFLDAHRGEQKTSLSVREMVALVIFAGQLAHPQKSQAKVEELKTESFRLADFFLKE